MRLSDREFRAMNRPFRRFLQKTVEFPTFQRMGLTQENQDILEIGCGSGYGALLLAQLHPKSYVGIDLMPEQLKLAPELAQKHGLRNAKFLLRDATDLSCFPDKSKDAVVIFGVLHHIPQWSEVLQECYRVLRDGGKLFVEEPDGKIIATGERLFHWGHPQEALFSLPDLEQNLTATGFTLLHQQKRMAFGFYAAQK